MITLYQIKNLYPSNLLKTSKDKVKRVKVKNERRETIFIKHTSDKISVSNMRKSFITQ